MLAPELKAGLREMVLNIVDVFLEAPEGWPTGEQPRRFFAAYATIPHPMFTPKEPSWGTAEIRDGHENFYEKRNIPKDALLWFSCTPPEFGGCPIVYIHYFNDGAQEILMVDDMWWVNEIPGWIDAA